MDKFQENDLRAMLKDMMPEGYPDASMWRHVVNDIINILDYETFLKNPRDDHERDMFQGFIDRSREFLIKYEGEEMFNALMEAGHRFKKQCWEHEPDAETATREKVENEVVNDYDGYDVLETAVSIHYHLLKPWRRWKAGDVIQYHEPQHAVGGNISGYWSLV